MNVNLKNFEFEQKRKQPLLVKLLNIKWVLSLMLFALLFITQMQAQVSTYSYAQGTGTYASLSGGNTVTLATGTTTNTLFPNQNIGFNFTFNCITYTTLGISTNGFVWFGSGSPSNAGLQPIGNASANLNGTGTIDGIIAAFGGYSATMQGAAAASYIRTQLTGSPGSQIFKINWQGYRVTGGSGNATLPSYSLWLYEGTNVIEEYVANQNLLGIVTTVNGQIGLRGTSNADCKTLSTPFNTSNTTWNIPTATSINSNTVYIDGLSFGIYCAAAKKFTWTPTVSCCTPPGTVATNFNFNSLTSSSANITFNRGNGDGGVIVIARDASAVTASPSNGTIYSNPSAPEFTNGTALSAGQIVVYAATGPNPGAAVSAPVNGLIAGHTYYFKIIEYNSSGTACYSNSALSGSVDIPGSNVLQVTGNVNQGAANQAIVQVQVNVASAATLSSLTFNTTGTTNITNDVTAARVWFTGASSTFATTTQFGSTITNPNGTHTVSGSQAIAAGANYFWVAYDASISATINNVLDAQCTSVTVGSPQTPSTTSPTGNRPIVSLGSMACAYSGSNIGTPAYATITQGVGTFTVVSGISAGTIDDQIYPSQTLGSGFSFIYNDVSYSNFGISSNGFIWFGSGTPAGTAYFPISTLNTAGVDGVISAYGANLINKTVLAAAPTIPAITVQTSGTAPNRICKIEWAGLVTSGVATTGGSNANRMDFQIWLYENGGTNGNRIEMYYRDQNLFLINANQLTGEVGLRGTTNSEFVNRTAAAGAWPSSTAGTTNNATCQYNTSSAWVAQNPTGNAGFRFVPSISKPTISGSLSNICSATTTTLTATTAIFPGGSTYQWYKDGLPISGETNSTLVASASGNYIVVANNSGCGKVSNSLAVTINSCGVPPSFDNCGSSTPQPIGIGQCGANVTYTASTASGTPTPTITYSHPSGSFFPIGVTTVTATATNGIGSPATCTFTVTVTDPIAPTITAPANITICSPTTVTLNIGTPSVSDNCGTPSVSNNHPSNTYPIGTTIVVWSAQDASGNISTANQTIIVRQANVAPTALLSSNTICTIGMNNSTTLTQTGGTLGDGAIWKWYKNALFTQLVGTSNAANAALVVTPTVNTTYYLRAEGASSPCASITASTASVTAITFQSAAATPGAIQGPIVICGLPTATYSVAPIAGCTYSWGLRPGMINPVSNSAGNVITVEVDESVGTLMAGNLLLNSTNACGSSAISQTRQIFYYPAAPGSISGPTKLCGLTSATYSCSSIASASSYSWEFPAGILPSGILFGPNTLTVSINPIAPINGSVSVTTSNACGDGVTKYLAINSLPSALGNIGGEISVCVGTSSTYTVAPLPEVGITYTWATTATTATLGSPNGNTSMLVNFASNFGPKAQVTLYASNACASTALKGMWVYKKTCALSPLSGNLQDETTTSNLFTANVYPNPANSELTISFETDKERVILMELFDAMGNKVLERKQSITEGTSILSSSIVELTEGIYLLRITDSKGNSLKRTAIIKQ